MHRRSVAVLILFALVPDPATSAERCPTSADMPKGVTLRRGAVTEHIRALTEHEIRTETVTKDLGTFVDITYDGLISIGPERTQEKSDTTRKFVYPTDYHAFRLEPGQSFTYDTNFYTGDWLFGVESTETINLKIVGRDVVRLGECTYPTLVVEQIIFHGTHGIMNDQVPEPRLYRLQFSPELHVVLFSHRAIEPPTLPDSFTAD